jgi:hypothetical protein
MSVGTSIARFGFDPPVRCIVLTQLLHDVVFCQSPYSEDDQVRVCPELRDKRSHMQVDPVTKNVLARGCSWLHKETFPEEPLQGQSTPYSNPHFSLSILRTILCIRAAGASRLAQEATPLRSSGDAQSCDQGKGLQ